MYYMNQKETNMKNRLDFVTSSSTIGSLWVDYRDKYLNLQPSYQRNYVWSDEFKNKLIYSLLKNYPIGSITIRKLSIEQMRDSFKSEVVDGQQRLTTIFDFIDNKFVISGDDAQTIFDDVRDQYTDEEVSSSKDKSTLIKKFNKNKKIEITYNLLPSRVQVQLNNYNLAISTINQAEDIDVAEYFRFVQNQERLRAGEIINSFIECPLDLYLEEKCDVKKLAKVLSIDNSRKEIQKTYYGIIGLLVDKLNLGCKDDDIISFADSLNSSSGVDENITKIAYKISEQLGFIASNCEEGCVKCNKRMLKFIMILSGLEYENYSEKTINKLKGLEEFNNKISSFNSAKKNEITRTFGEDFDENDLENHRLIALITKGGHNRSRVIERTSLLIKLLNKYYY